MVDALRRMGVNPQMAYGASWGAIVLSLVMWFFRRGGERTSAERLAIFVGLWPPTLMLLGQALEER